MKCKRIEKWISDCIDGELSRRKQKILESHVEECTSCRAYRQHLEIIQEETGAFLTPDVAAGYWQESIFRLKARLSSPDTESYQPRKTKPSIYQPAWKWAWAGAGALFIIVLGLFIIRGRTRAPQEIYAFSFEETVDRIYQGIGNNTELENKFNSAILASINENVGGVKSEENFFRYENPLFWEAMTEEEMKFIESEIKKEIKS